MFEPNTILLVEDDADICGVITMILESDGYPVATASNGAEALELIHREGPPKMILLDMQMPEMDGWQFASRLFSEFGHTIPVIVMTATSNVEQRAADLNADGWLGKPFDLYRLRSTVEKFATHP